MAATEKSAPKKQGRSPMGSGRKLPAPAPAVEAASPEAALAWVSGAKGGGGKGERLKPGPKAKALDTPTEPISMKIPKPLYVWLQRAAFKGKEDESELASQKDLVCLGIYEVLKEKHPGLMPNDFDPSMIAGAE